MYMQWVRWSIIEALAGRPHVFVNMDETTISQLTSSNQGMVPGRRVQREEGMIRRRRKLDRHDVRTCLIGAVCNDPTLQPHLPQVVLPSYSKHAKPPVEVLKDYKNTGAPLEYWHDTNGWTSSTTIKRWLTRLRSVVSSFNVLMWIAVVWDCASVHLNEDVLRHARRLGILVLFVPAGLTHRLQVLDVYIYSYLKRRVRENMLGYQCRSDHGLLSRHARIQSVGKAIHEAIVRVNCSDYFRSLGLSSHLDSLRHDVFDMVGHAPIAPVLPDRSQFAFMTGLAEHTHRTANLHNLTMQGWLHLRRQPVTARPTAGAVFPLRHAEPADTRGRLHQHAGLLSWDDVRMLRLRRLHAAAHMDLPPAEQALNSHFRAGR